MELAGAKHHRNRIHDPPQDCDDRESDDEEEEGHDFHTETATPRPRAQTASISASGGSRITPAVQTLARWLAVSRSQRRGRSESELPPARGGHKGATKGL